MYRTLVGESQQKDGSSWYSSEARVNKTEQMRIGGTLGCQFNTLKYVDEVKA